MTSGISTSTTSRSSTHALQNTYNRAVGADKLWKEPPYLDGQGVTVAVVDSGITDQLDLKKNGNSRIKQAASFVTTTVGTADGYGHGTHVAGIIGGNGSGVEQRPHRGGARR